MYQSHKITKKQLLVLSFLQELHDALSAQELHRALKEKGYGIGLATVYRALENLKIQGAVKATTTPNGEALYSITPFDRHHLHCLQCGSSFAIDTCPLEGINQKLKQTYNFEVYYHTLEFFGLCHECSQKQQSKQRWQTIQELRRGPKSRKKVQANSHRGIKKICAIYLKYV